MKSASNVIFWSVCTILSDGIEISRLNSLFSSRNFCSLISKQFKSSSGIIPCRFSFPDKTTGIFSCPFSFHLIGSSCDSSQELVSTAFVSASFCFNHSAIACSESSFFSVQKKKAIVFFFIGRKQTTSIIQCKIKTDLILCFINCIGTNKRSDRSKQFIPL